jgi:hypothetical protein
MTDQDKQTIRNGIRNAVAALEQSQMVTEQDMYGKLQEIIFQLIDLMEDV